MVNRGAADAAAPPRAAPSSSRPVLTDVTTDMVITKEETFGPVAPLYRSKTDAEAIEIANDTPTLTLRRSRGREGRGPHLTRRRGARIRHRRHQRGHHLDGDRPLPRHEGKRHRPLA